jgi:hypothetical protein
VTDVDEETVELAVWIALGDWLLERSVEGESERESVTEDEALPDAELELDGSAEGE